METGKTTKVEIDTLGVGDSFSHLNAPKKIYIVSAKVPIRGTSPQRYSVIYKLDGKMFVSASCNDIVTKHESKK